MRTVATREDVSLIRQILEWASDGMKTDYGTDKDKNNRLFVFNSNFRITGVKLSDGTEYDIPLLSQDVTSWG